MPTGSRGPGRNGLTSAPQDDPDATLPCSFTARLLSAAELTRWCQPAHGSPPGPPSAFPLRSSIACAATPPRHLRPKGALRAGPSAGAPGPGRAARGLVTARTRRCQAPER